MCEHSMDIALSNSSSTYNNEIERIPATISNIVTHCSNESIMTILINLKKKQMYNMILNFESVNFTLNDIISKFCH